MFLLVGAMVGNTNKVGVLMNTFDINGKVIFQYNLYKAVLRKMQAMPLLPYREAVAEFGGNSESACGLLTGTLAGREHCPILIDGKDTFCEVLKVVDFFQDKYETADLGHFKELWVDCIIELNRKMRKDHEVRAGEIIYRTFK